MRQSPSDGGNARAGGNGRTFARARTQWAALLLQMPCRPAAPSGFDAAPVSTECKWAPPERMGVRPRVAARVPTLDCDAECGTSVTNSGQRANKRPLQPALDPRNPGSVRSIASIQL